jgi:flagellar biosynthesis/type III secretory pathway chaperone
MPTLTLQSPAPLDLASEISDLLDALTSVQGELLGVLGEKRQALATANIVRLSELAPREEQLAQKLQDCQERQGQGSDNLAKLATKTSGGKPSKLGSRVKETSARMRLLQHHSLANWVLAQRSLLHVSQLLEIIATGGRMQPTYGDKESLHARGSLVNQEA